MNLSPVFRVLLHAMVCSVFAILYTAVDGFVFLKYDGIIAEGEQEKKHINFFVMRN